MINTTTALPSFLKLLAHDVRWQLLSLLSRSDYRVQELTAALARPQNLVSYHLRKLREEALVTERRSSADSRDVYYSLDMEQLQALYLSSGQALHPALTMPAVPAFLPNTAVPRRFLFLCTYNSARSQLAEGLLRAMVPASVMVQSAGNRPTAVHPLAIRAAYALNIDIHQQTSTHLDQFIDQEFDYVITVCDQVREICPTFPATTEQIHWSLPDPAAVVGSEEVRYQAFVETARNLQVRLQFFLQMIVASPNNKTTI